MNFAQVAWQAGSTTGDASGISCVNADLRRLIVNGGTAAAFSLVQPAQVAVDGCDGDAPAVFVRRGV